MKSDGPMANMLRSQVQDMRRRLLQMDGTVTRLTAELKRSRRELWTQQREQSGQEAQIAQILAGRADELSPDVRTEEERLVREEAELAQQLSEARAQAARWSSVARRQDSMLQQERDQQKGDAHSILAKHPAGEVFLPNLPHDTDSDDGYEMDGPRKLSVNHRGGSAQEDVSLGTSDEDEEALKGPSRRPPPRVPLGLDSEKDDDESDGGSSLVSPSAESMSNGSNSGKSPMGEPPSRAQMLTSAPQAAAAAPARQGQPAGRKGQRSSSSSETASEDDEASPVHGGLAMASLAGRALMESVKKPEDEASDNDGSEEAKLKLAHMSTSEFREVRTNAKMVEQLQAQVELAGTASRGRSGLPEDEAEEVSSEDDFEEETSRSA
mmetsp:Transcript_42228/g.134092  ORF Transcript_42228/g.134092 Transcript_42228/m.134092 type:complete len:381 (+) Transcript_42228:530-1672(+)